MQRSIMKKYYPEMPIMRQVCAALPFNHAHDLDQPSRRILALDMFERTSQEHIHNLVHKNPDFQSHLLAQGLFFPYHFACAHPELYGDVVNTHMQFFTHLLNTEWTQDPYGDRFL